MTDRANRRCILVTFATFEGDAGERVAIRLARRFGGVCEALLVGGDEGLQHSGAPFGEVIDPRTGVWRAPDTSEVATEAPRQIARGTRRLADLAAAEGLETTVRVAPAASAADSLAEAGSEDVLIIAQPADPLTRRSFPFSAWRAAAYRAPSLTVYAPPDQNGENGAIVALIGSANDPASAFANTLTGDADEAVITLSAPKSGNTSRIVQAATHGAPVSILVITRGAIGDDPASLTRLAADLGCAIIVLEPNASS